MTFRFLLPESRPLVDVDYPDGPGNLPQQTRALRRDYGRASRLFVGIGATLGFGIALLVLGGALDLVATGGALLGVPFGLVGLGGAVVTGWLLLGLHRSGRRLARALASRYRSTYGPEHRGGLGDAGLARYFVFEPFLFWRIALASITLLGAIMLLSIAGFMPEQSAAGRLLSGAYGLVLLVAGCGLFGGTFRVNAAHSRRDPVQRRLWGD
ncbi:hypothetical protein [Agromyces seonyuensis]|uniref:Uncharacterized protein n=1 Tax=Agromyces seonyuensis TaxID=2662446 RepID=A0A6I4NYL2_9MICO|nr:hypothetical protein [Agromyces seonyuensis]MWB98272.1 hypothetical protein [Agromyces seonyuensis]